MDEIKESQAIYQALMLIDGENIKNTLNLMKDAVNTLYKQTVFNTTVQIKKEEGYSPENIRFVNMKYSDFQIVDICAREIHLILLDNITKWNHNCRDAADFYYRIALICEKEMKIIKNKYDSEDPDLRDEFDRLYTRPMVK